MELSIFLAKLLGLYMLIVAAIWLVHKEQVNLSIQDFAASRGLILFAGAINIIAGLAIAIGHPIWEFSWRGLITLLAYIMIAQGIIRFGFAGEIQNRAIDFMQKGYWGIIAFLVIVGGFLTYSGFMIH